MEAVPRQARGFGAPQVEGKGAESAAPFGKLKRSSRTSPWSPGNCPRLLRGVVRHEPSRTGAVRTVPAALGRERTSDPPGHELNRADIKGS